MAKKAAKSILAAVPATETPVTSETSAQMKIDELTLAKLLRYMDKARAAKMEIQLTAQQIQAAFNQFIQSNPEMKKLDDKVGSLQQEVRDAEKAYAEIIAKIGSEYKIDMNQFAFDDETGALTPLPGK